MFIKQLVITFAIFIYFSNLLISYELKIISKVDDEIITNIDLENQIKYFSIINLNLNNLNQLELLELSKNSIVREIIKKKETDKYISIKEQNQLGDKLIEQNYLNLGFEDKKEYLKFIKKKGLNLEFIKEKLILEHLWNTLVYKKFKEKLKINKIEIKKRVILNNKNKEKINEFNISEILIDFDTDFDELKRFIENHGFEAAAAKYSISDSSSIGGNLGWININNLTQTLQKKISSLKIGQSTDPIKIPNGILILKINSKREIKSKFDLNEAIDKQILFEQNRQLKEFSINYYKKLRQNTIINEY